MSKKISELKNYGVSVKTKLLNIARDAGRDYNQVVTRYLQERLLHRLSVSRYHESFYLKGGALLYAYDRQSARPTLDIDLLGHNISRDKQFLTNVFADICSIQFVEDGVRFDPDTVTPTEIMADRHYNGVNITVRENLDTIDQMVSMDIGFGDVIIPEPVSLDYPLFLEEMPAIQLNAYSLETVVAEKFQTMIEKSVGNSRMKDYYDVYSILTEGRVRKDVLKEAIMSVFANRETSYTENHPLFTEAFASEPSRIALWEGFLKRIKYRGNLAFADVMKVITSELQPVWDGMRA